MQEIEFIADFSRNHCIAICAVLVPANLIATLQTLLFACAGSIRQTGLMASVSSLYALTMLLHVATWWAIGVVMAPTYILSALAIVCLLWNWGALFLRLHYANRGGSNANLKDLVLDLRLLR